eukprot:513602_1
MDLDFDSFSSQKKESEIEQEDNQLLQSTNGDITKWEEEKEMLSQDFKNNMILYDDDKQDRFKSVVKLVKKHSRQAEESKKQFDKKVEHLERNEMKVDNENDKEETEEKASSYSGTVLAECIYVMMQVSAADKQVDKTLFKTCVSKRGDEITAKLIPLVKVVKACFFQESHLIITLAKIIMYYKKKYVVEQIIPSMCEEQVWKDDNYNNNHRITENFVEISSAYSLIGFIKITVKDAKFECVNEQAAINYLKLCVNQKGVELFGAIKILLLLLHNSLSVGNYAKSLSILHTTEKKKKWIKSYLKQKWQAELWCLTSIFANDGAPKDLSQQSRDTLHTHFMSYMKPFINAKIH